MLGWYAPYLAPSSSLSFTQQQAVPEKKVLLSLCGCGGDPRLKPMAGFKRFAICEMTLVR
jgi:hypothetical protein